MRKSITVQSVDNSLATEISKAIEDIALSQDTEKELQLNLDSAQGQIADAIQIVQQIHDSEIDLSIHCRGQISAAGTILVAAGKPAHRSAELNTVFVLNDDAIKAEGKSRKTKNQNSEILEYFLGQLTGKQKLIKELIRKNDVISVFQAVNCKILDEAGSFRSKYAKKRAPKSSTVDNDEKVKATV